ncbi:hypothetical protein OC846_002916 [Tilletia horrida]|uniref:SET domain-containing protein n=1 Tax=Tilletia horrida TaxID=155126 RepID=A0AAN6JYF9_9BASI|nr:hypothetical protein OC846_002916 [Tilletia horrida]
MRSSSAGRLTARQARLAAARREEELRQAKLLRRLQHAAASRSASRRNNDDDDDDDDDDDGEEQDWIEAYYTDPLLSDPFLPPPPQQEGPSSSTGAGGRRRQRQRQRRLRRFNLEADDGIDPDIDAELNTDVRALRKKPKLAFDQFEIRSLSASRMDGVRLPDIAQADRNMVVHEAQRKARLARSAYLSEGTIVIAKERLLEMGLDAEIMKYAATPSSSSSNQNHAGNSLIALGPASHAAAALLQSASYLSAPPSIWKSPAIDAIAHHRALWLAWVMEHENSTADLTVSNEIDNEPCPPWDWCFTNTYISDNLTTSTEEPTVSSALSTEPRRRSGSVCSSSSSAGMFSSSEMGGGGGNGDTTAPLRGCSCDDDSCNPDTCECFARLKLIDPITWSTESDFAYTKLGRLRNGHFEQCVILECNESCGCSAACRNRLVQHGRTVALDVFKTAHCGWGVRAKHHIPKNTFIAAYAGELIDGRGMHERGQKYSKTATTYQLDIDSFHIRCLTRIGPFNEWREQHMLDRMDPALEETYTAADEWWAIHDPTHVDPILTVDAGLWGNLTRFFNHSCDPNIDLYPVYTDCQDITRPYLAFFARRDIAAGQELRFNYNGDLDEEVTAAAASLAASDPNGKNGRKAVVSPSKMGGGKGPKQRTWDDVLAEESTAEEEEEETEDDAVTKRNKAVVKERRRQQQSLLLMGSSSSSLTSASAAAAASGPSSSSSSASLSLGTMMAELVPSGSREVELVDGVKAMVCRCGAPNCKGQVFAS